MAGKSVSTNGGDGKDNRTFLIWQCKDFEGEGPHGHGCGEQQIRATKAFLEGGTGWMDIQSRCRKCGRKKRLFAKNTQKFDCKEQAEMALGFMKWGPLA